jgi:hypothetical protein
MLSKSETGNFAHKRVEENGVDESCRRSLTSASSAKGHKPFPLQNNYSHTAQFLYFIVSSSHHPLRNSFLVPVTNEALQTILGKYTGLWKIL